MELIDILAEPCSRTPKFLSLDQDYSIASFSQPLDKHGRLVHLGPSDDNGDILFWLCRTLLTQEVVLELCKDKNGNGMTGPANEMKWQVIHGKDGHGKSMTGTEMHG